MRRIVLAFCLGLACAPSVAADRATVINMYGWSDYFPKSLLDEFESESGIHVNYTVLASPETAESAISAGKSNYDIVTMNAAPELAREIPKGFWKELDPAAIPNARNADPDVMQRLGSVDPGNQHAVPWLWGTIGVIYNPSMIYARMGDAPIDSLDMVFKREVAAKFAGCGISILDSWRDMLPMVSRYIGQDRLSAEPNKLMAVMAKLRELRPYLRRIASFGYYEQLADGELCLSIGYSRDAMLARRIAQDGATGQRIEYSFARESVPFYIDSLVIPADAPNAAGGQAFINFVMRPEISADVTRYTGLASANAAAIALLPAAVRGNLAVYPPPDVRERFELPRVYTADEVRRFTRAWLQFKSGG